MMEPVNWALWSMSLLQTSKNRLLQNRPRAPAFHSSEPKMFELPMRTHVRGAALSCGHVTVELTHGDRDGDRGVTSVVVMRLEDSRWKTLNMDTHSDI
mmetsp:Transcript_3349/g.6433  ORF Transcript_3349/g.6433 Transcript_3349/m.6433 type:complete len:98 (+) Transcript_3349:101-394(+)